MVDVAWVYVIGVAALVSGLLAGFFLGYAVRGE